MTRAERQKLEEPPAPDGWRHGPGRGHWLHETMVAEVHKVDADYVCSANQFWLGGTYPTLECAAIVALAASSQTWADLWRHADLEYEADE